MNNYKRFPFSLLNLHLELCTALPLFIFAIRWHILGKPLVIKSLQKS